MLPVHACSSAIRLRGGDGLDATTLEPLGRRLTQQYTPCLLSGTVKSTRSADRLRFIADGVRWGLTWKGASSLSGFMDTGVVVRIEGSCDAEAKEAIGRSPPPSWPPPPKKKFLSRSPPPSGPPPPKKKFPSKDDFDGSGWIVDFGIGSRSADVTPRPSPRASALITSSPASKPRSSSSAPSRNPDPFPVPSGTTVWPKDPPNPPPIHTMTVLIMALDVCGRKSSVNYDIYKTALNGPLPRYFQTASFGAYSFPLGPNSNRVIFTKVPVGCSAYRDNSLAADKKRSAYAQEADAWVLQNLNINVYLYTHHLYLLPDEVEEGQYGVANCFGLGDNNLDLWMPAQTANPNVVLMIHELGHNMGLAHSRGYASDGTILEYGDGSCPMGSAQAPVMFNAPNAVSLGWTVPQAVWKSDDLPVGKWTQFKLRGLADARISSLQISPSDWMNGAGGWDTYEHLFISFRHHSPNNADAGLAPDYRDKVQVHRYSANTFYNSCGGVLALSNLDATSSPVWPKPGSTHPADTSSPLLAVRVARIDTVGGAAYINVCRAQSKGRESGAQCRDGLDNDCDGRVDNC